MAPVTSGGAAGWQEGQGGGQGCGRRWGQPGWVDGLLAGARGSLGHSPDLRQCVAPVGGTLRLEEQPEGTLGAPMPACSCVASRPTLCAFTASRVCACVCTVLQPTHSPPVPAAAGSRSPRGRGALVPEAARGPHGEDTASAGRALVSLLGVLSEDGSGGPASAIGPGSAPFPPIRAAACQCPAAAPGPGAALPPRRGREQCTHMETVSGRTRASLCCLWAVRVLQGGVRMRRGRS